MLLSEPRACSRSSDAMTVLGEPVERHRRVAALEQRHERLAVARQLRSTTSGIGSSAALSFALSLRPAPWSSSADEAHVESVAVDRTYGSTASCSWKWDQQRRDVDRRIPALSKPTAEGDGGLAVEPLAPAGTMPSRSLSMPSQAPLARLVADRRVASQVHEPAPVDAGPSAGRRRPAAAAPRASRPGESARSGYVGSASRFWEDDRSGPRRSMRGFQLGDQVGDQFAQALGRDAHGHAGRTRTPARSTSPPRPGAACRRTARSRWRSARRRPAGRPA